MMGLRNPLLVISGPPASGKTRLAEYIARAAGPRVLRVTSTIPERQLRCLLDGGPDLLVVDPFEPIVATTYLMFVISTRSRPTVLTSIDRPSAWAAQAGKPAARRVIAKIVC